MVTNEPNVDNAIGIIDPDYNPILVASDIEDRTTILENASATDVPLDVSRLCPVGLPHLPKPSHHRFAGIGGVRGSVQEGLNRANRNHPHRGDIAWSQSGTKSFYRCSVLLSRKAARPTIDQNPLPSASLLAYVHVINPPNQSRKRKRHCPTPLIS